MQTLFEVFFEDDFWTQDERNMLERAKKLSKTLPLGFGAPRVAFETIGILDMKPFTWEETDEGYHGVIKTLGIEKPQVELFNEGLKVSGKNILEDSKPFATSIPFPIAKNIVDNIVEIKHKTTAGLTFIDLIVQKPEKRNIKITEIE